MADHEKANPTLPSDEPTAKPPTDLTVKTVSEHPGPVGFFDLFRYATKLELAMNAVGILCAIASGAAQVSAWHDQVAA